MIYHLERYERGGEVTLDLPGSKSLSNRFLILRSIFPEIELEGLSDAEDTRVLNDALNHLNREEYNVGAAGTAFRFALAYFSLIPGKRVLTGSDRLKQRPIGPLVESLRDLGAEIRYLENPGYAPLEITGGLLSGNEVWVDPTISSQFISALLLIAPGMENGLTIRFKGKPVSSSYIEMTRWCLKKVGVLIESEEGLIRVIPPLVKPTHRIKIERDWTSASYWYALVAMDPGMTIHLPGLWNESPQGDSRQAIWFEELGVVTRFGDDGITLCHTRSRVGNIRMDLDLHPDLAQTLAVLLGAMGIGYFLTGLQTLKHKETDRLVALQKELSKFDLHTRIDDHSISLEKGSMQPSDSSVETYEDHRMAMAFSILCDSFPIRVKDPEVVVKSYPGFWQNLEKCGVRILEES